MKKIIKLALAVAMGLGLSSGAHALTIDGNLSDWGLKNTGNQTQWTPSGNADGKGTYDYAGHKIYYSVEDYTAAGSGQVWPGYGGQAYDAEALYLTWDTSNLYIALVTGHDPATVQNPAKNSFGAGDFALNFWNGSTNDGSYEFGIKNPKTTGHFSANVYRTTNADWNKDPYWSTGAVTSMKDPATGTLKGTATLSIQKGHKNMGAAFNANHWIYELSVSRSLFGHLDDPGSKLNVSWAMNCANDIIEADPTSPTPVPEPATLALLGLSLPAVAWRRRRQQARRQQ